MESGDAEVQWQRWLSTYCTLRGVLILLVNPEMEGRTIE